MANERGGYGAHIRELRTMAGKTMEEMGKAAEVSVPYLSDIERGNRYPSPEVARRIQKFLGAKHTIEKLVEEKQSIIAAEYGVAQ